MKKIGIFYGPVGGTTEKIAKQVKDAFGNTAVDIHPIKDTTAAMVNLYEIVIFGCSTLGAETWNGDNVKNGWNWFRPEIEKIDVNGKVFAFFGTGDHITYSRNFVDAMGILAKMLIEKDARIAGECSTNDYEFADSEAVINGKFIGLPIDEDFEPEKTQPRIENWVKELKDKLL
ncbi:MAG: flavodoxin [Bacteroidales bacterium]